MDQLFLIKVLMVALDALIYTLGDEGRNEMWHGKVRKDVEDKMKHIMVKG